jgi:hypothetical protein
VNLRKLETEETITLEGFLLFFAFQSIDELVLDSPATKTFHDFACFPLDALSVPEEPLLSEDAPALSLFAPPAPSALWADVLEGEDVLRLLA